MIFGNTHGFCVSEFIPLWRCLWIADVSHTEIVCHYQSRIKRYVLTQVYVGFLVYFGFSLLSYTGINQFYIEFHSFSLVCLP